MKIGILIDHPTQFEGPFFRFAAQEGNHSLRIIYANPVRTAKVFDPELNASVTWGIDLLSGYDYAILPTKGWLGWLSNDIRRQKYDLLIINGYSDKILLAATILGRLNNTKLGLRLDTVLFRNQSLIKLNIKRILFFGLEKLFSHFFAIGSLTVAYLRKMGIPADRISIFSYAIDVDYFRRASQMDVAARRVCRERYGLPPGDRVILSVTKFHPRESPWDLLRAAHAFVQQECSLLLVGDGPERQALEDYARTQDTRIIFSGYVPYPELPRVYGIADLFVHAVGDEPWGVSVAEAMACGLPVIASSRVGSGYDLIAPGRNGFMYSSGNPDDLASKLRETLRVGRSDDVRRCNDEILARWDYASTWQAILDAGKRV